MKIQFDTDAETIRSNFSNIPEPFNFPMFHYPPNVNTYRSMAHTPGPILIRDNQPIPVYDPSNGLMSHGILFHYTTMDYESN
jgi:hypothetical protein